MGNKSKVLLKKKTSVNSNVKVNNKTLNGKSSVKMKAPLLQNKKITQTGNGRKIVKLAVNRNTKIKKT